MKKAFTVYVPDGCHLKMLNATILVEKNDGNENGVTVFTQGENDITENNDWLFQLKGNAIRVSEVKRMSEIENIKSDIINALKDKHYVNSGFDDAYILVSSEDGKKLFQVIVREVE